MYGHWLLVYPQNAFSCIHHLTLVSIESVVNHVKPISRLLSYVLCFYILFVRTILQITQSIFVPHLESPSVFVVPHLTCSYAQKITQPDITESSASCIGNTPTMALETF